MAVVRKLKLTSETDPATDDLVITFRYELRRGDVERTLAIRIPNVDLSESDKAARWGFAPSLKHRRQLITWLVDQLSKALDSIQAMPARPPKKEKPPPPEA